MVISGSDVGGEPAGVALPDDGADADGAGAADAVGVDEAGDEAASVDPGGAVAPLVVVALPSEDWAGPGAEALAGATAFPVLAFVAAGVVAGGFVAPGAAGGCAAVPVELVAFGAEEFPCPGAGVGALGEPPAPCDSLAGGALCAGGGVVWLGFFSNEGR
jgi:hypothetical protein